MQSNGREVMLPFAPSQSKDRSRPPPLHIPTRNVPFQSRVNLDITPDHPDFILMERYFDRQLRKHHITVDVILKEHFNPTEIEYLVRSDDSLIVEKQKKHAEEFRQTLATTFKGKLPTLQCKMAMLYFGLRVAPMKKALSQGWKSTTSATYDDGRVMERNPIAFLDIYGPTNPVFGPSDGSDTGAMPSLRGGSLDEDDMQMVLWDIEEDSSVNLGEQANDQLALSIRGGGLAYDEYPIHAAVAGQKRPPKNLMLLFGRQGYTGIGATWSELVEGVAWLLGKDNQTKHSDPSVHIAMDLFQCGIDAGTGKITSIQYLQSREGRFYLDADGYVNRPDDEFHKFIMENMTLNHWYQGRRCFVRHVRDIRPKSFMPDATGESTIEVALSLKDSPQERTVYMRITPSPTQYNSPSQYHPEFYRALSVLLTDEHAWMSLSIRSGSNPPVSSQKIMCFGQDMPQEILQAIPANIVGNITVTIEARDLDDVAVITPRSGYAGVVQNTEINDMHGISEMIVDYCLETNASKTLVKYVELWIPACAYHGDFNANPVIDHYEDGRPISDQHQWHEDISRIKHQEEGDFKKGFSIWGRPVFIEYTLRNAFDSAEPQECVVQDLLELDLATFKALVSEYLFPQRYDGYNRNHQLLLDQGDPGDDPAFVVRFDTTVKDWEHIKRRIASNSIYIRIVKPEERCEMEVATKWSVDPSSYWGPCYQVPTEDIYFRSAEDPEPRQSQGTTMSWPGKDTSDINDRRKTRRLAKPRSALEPFSLRAQTFWKPPSVFSNPFKPVIPLNAPPIEPLLRVGRFMPTVTMGIRTATEMAQLEEEVYRLRNMVIDRIRECPYSDCRRQFQNGDNDALDVHLQEEHTSLRCPYCVATHTWEKGSGSELYHKSADSAMQHFLQYHRDDMMSKFGIDTTGHDSVDNGIPGIVLANDKIQRTTGTYRFCDQCGRNHNLCFREEDRQNHRNKCYRLNDDDTDEVLQQYRSQRFCQYCGVASGVRCSNAQNCPSGDGSPEPAPIISCYLCGFDFSNSGDLCRREHREGCRPLCGRSRDFCGFCGCDFKDRTLVDKLNHAKFCEERPKPRKVKCPSCWEELETPEDAIFHVEEDHGAPTVCLWCDQTFPTDDTAWGPEVKVQHFAFHMGSYPQVRGAHSGTKVRQGQEKCPAFNICGVVVGQMSRDQYLQHWKQAHDTSVDLSGVKGYHPNGQRIKRPQGLVDEAMELDKQSDCHSIKGASSPREGEKIRNCVPIEGEYKWSFDTHARAASPDWDQVLGTKMSGNGQKFRPGESMRCSRCFKPAPSAQHPNYDYEVEIHTNPKFSCQIRRDRGEDRVNHSPVPNRSGWIIFPKNFDFKAARRNFIVEYPAYSGTVFPVHDDRVDAVYDGPQPNRGQQIDDVLSGDMTTIGMARHSLPWPPHPGQGQFTNLSEKGFAPVKVPPLAVGSEREHISRTKMVGVVPNIKSSQSSTGSTKQTSVPTPRTSPLCLIVEDSASDCSSSGEDGAGGSNLGTKTGPRGNVGDTDLTHAKDSRHDAPEEDTDERTTRRDGTPGDLAILEPGMEDIPAGYKSPQDHNNPSKKRGRTPGNQFNAVGDEPNSKRARNTTSASGDQTSAADIEADQAQGAATPAPGTIVDEENPEKQGKSKNKSTAKSNPKLATPTMKDKLEALSASNPPNPDSQSITTRKSARTPLNETAQDSDKTPVRTPARRRQRQIVGDYGDVPLEPSEIIPGSSVVAQPVTDKPTKRGRKKVGKPYETIQEDEQLEGYEIVP